MRLGRIFDIEVYLDFTILILAILVADGVWNFLSRANPNSDYLLLMLSTGVATVGVIASILFHEVGHSLTGRHFGVPTNHITLHMFGGVASMSTQTSKAKVEFWVAIAGPLVSLALFVAFKLIGQTFGILSLGLIANMFGALGAINLFLAIFNLIPAFPMDGGRVFRAAVWHITGKYLMATKATMRLGQVLLGIGVIIAISMMFGKYIPLFGTGFGNAIWLLMIIIVLYVVGQKELRGRVI